MNTTRSLIRSGWERLTFYGPRPKNNGYMEVDGISELDAEPVREEVKPEPPLPKVFDDEPDFVLEGRNWGGRGRLTEDGFVVFAGSFANDCAASFRANRQYYPLRVTLEEMGVIVDGMFTRDYCFRSVAQAGCILAAANIQATKKWHTEPDEDGETMTYEECHPKTRGIKRYERKLRERRKAKADAVARTADVVLDGRAWRSEWRGQNPVRDRGLYSPDTYVARAAICG